MRDRLMVGRDPLEVVILVRVQVPQQKINVSFFAVGRKQTALLPLGLEARSVMIRLESSRGPGPVVEECGGARAEGESRSRRHSVLSRVTETLSTKHTVRSCSLWIRLVLSALRDRYDEQQRYTEYII